MSLSGEMMYVGALWRGVLVINSQRVAVDLLEKQSNIYSDRPNYVSASEILTRHLDLPMMPYGDLYAVNCPFYSSVLIFHRWRRFRRVSVEGFSKSVVNNFYLIQGREALMLALAQIRNPSDPEKHCQRHASLIILSVNSHFTPVESEDDPVVPRGSKIGARRARLGGRQRSSANLCRYSLSPLRPRDGQRDTSLVAHRSLRRAALLDRG
ncbi:hypothetical protein EI94DRAFT_1069445 [Lactarius quietus]|nr:hypothetical protein EI94DRAFT_1069445 [Lactarius quietus]